MGTQVAVNHRTTYEYDRPVTLSPHVIRLRPAPHCRTPVSRYSLRIDPPDHFLNWQQDPHGNHLARAVFQSPARRLRIEVDLVAELAVVNPFDFFLEPSAERFPFAYEPRLARDLHPYLETEPAGPELTRFLAGVDTRPRSTVDLLVTLNRDLERRIDYEKRMEPGVRPCDDTLAGGRGSCRDTAWLLAQVLRNLGLAARFVSGYLIELVPDDGPLGGSAEPPRDAHGGRPLADSDATAPGGPAQPPHDAPRRHHATDDGPLDGPAGPDHDAPHRHHATDDHEINFGGSASPARDAPRRRRATDDHEAHPDGPAGPDHDATELHAWAETYLPGAGWVGLDPTSGLLAAEGHLPLAATAEPETAAPVSGSVSTAEVAFDHAVTVTRLRPTSPEAGR